MFNEHGDPGHSINFNGMNTWTRWHLFPSSRPYVAPPEPKIKMEEVTGMTGVLDYSDVLTEDTHYKMRSGSWNFIMIPVERDFIAWKHTFVKDAIIEKGSITGTKITHIVSLNEKLEAKIPDDCDSCRIVIGGSKYVLDRTVEKNGTETIATLFSDDPYIKVIIKNDTVESIEYGTDVYPYTDVIMSLYYGYTTKVKDWKQAGLSNYEFTKGKTSNGIRSYTSLSSKNIDITTGANNPKYRAVINNREFELSSSRTTYYIGSSNNRSIRRVDTITGDENIEFVVIDGILSSFKVNEKIVSDQDTIRLYGHSITVTIIDGLLSSISYPTSLNSDNKATVSLYFGVTNDGKLEWTSTGLENVEFEDTTLDPDTASFNNLEEKNITVNTPEGYDQYKIVINGTDYELSTKYDAVTLAGSGITVRIVNGILDSISYPTTIDNSLTAKISLVYTLRTSITGSDGSVSYKYSYENAGLNNTEFEDTTQNEKSVVFDNLTERNISIATPVSATDYIITINGVKYNIAPKKESGVPVSLFIEGTTDLTTWTNVGFLNKEFIDGTSDASLITYEDLDNYGLFVYIPRSLERYKIEINGEEIVLDASYSGSNDLSGTLKLTSDNAEAVVKNRILHSLRFKGSISSHTTNTITISYEETVNGIEETWKIVYRDLYEMLHGKYFNRIELEDDPGWNYEGRVWVSTWNNNQQQTEVTINYQLLPYKHLYINGNDWLWKDLFDNTIFYGTFNVSGSKWRTIINPETDNLNITATCTEEVIADNKTTGESITLVKGTNTKRLALTPGDNIILFTGNADVTLEYLGDTSL